MKTEKSQAIPSNRAVADWVSEMAKLTKPDSVYWCNGSEEERERLTEEAVRRGILEPLDPSKLPGCYLHRSNPNDVARTEHLTFICTPSKDEAGPTNNWMAPDEAYRKVSAIFDGAMKGRTMYVVPFIMGVPGSPYAKVGVQLTDSIYVVLNMRIMTRMGEVAWKQLDATGEFTRCLHSLADLDVNRRFILHFPQDNTIWSVGSGYGGNALLGKKCLALRIASALGRREGWLAEHMLILGIEDPQGKVTYVTASFPSACGKTNLAMLVPPISQQGYKVWTVGDDIAWLRIGSDGRLWAVNPEAGFFGVAPGTSKKSNPNAIATIQRNSIFTNVARTPEGTVWWEGMDGEPPREAIDWRGNKWTPASSERAAHPNSRFTAPASQCPSLSPEWQNPEGVPISAIIFGGRRAHLAPLVYESFNWQHGTFVGASLASETTAAAMHSVGVVRRDPMAMLPFCGYNMGDYFGHWLAMGRRLKHPPKIFNVNWFRTDPQGKFIWPGFGENIRVLKWILERVSGGAAGTGTSSSGAALQSQREGARAAGAETSSSGAALQSQREGAGGAAEKTPIGYVPTPDAIDLEGLPLSRESMKTLVEVNPKDWQEEIVGIEEWFKQFGSHLPEEMGDELKALRNRLGAPG